MQTLGVLVPIDPERPMPPPEARPIGRAALALGGEGLELVFGDTLRAGRMSGVIARPGGWETVHERPVSALHDRYPSQRRADRFAQILSQLGGLPLGNPLALTMLCRDKLACQRLLEAEGVRQPDVVAASDGFAAALDGWGAGFLKPRYGALGIGVAHVLPGDTLPAVRPGAVPGRDDPAILQRAVPPPAGWAGRSVRVLCQRLTDGTWWQSTGVVRQSREDPVVNAARGAEVVSATVLSDATRAAITTLCDRTCVALSAALDGCWLVELGVDLVLDSDEQPWLIEVNSRPRGRLEALASSNPDRYLSAHVAACARPLRRLAALTA